jgi:hypothetical protein
MSREDLEQYNVVIAVFVQATGVDYGDAAAIAQMALRRALVTANTSDGDQITIDATFRDQPGDITIAGLKEVGVAVGNGYLWTQPTSKIYREQGLEREDNEA